MIHRNGSGKICSFKEATGSRQRNAPVPEEIWETVTVTPPIRSFSRPEDGSCSCECENDPTWQQTSVPCRLPSAHRSATFTLIYPTQTHTSSLSSIFSPSPLPFITGRPPPPPPSASYPSSSHHFHFPVIQSEAAHHRRSCGLNWDVTEEVSTV